MSHPYHLIAAYGDLSSEEREYVDTHLQLCIACRELHAAFAAQDQALHSLRTQVPPDLVPALGRRQRVRLSRRPVWPPLLAVAAAAALLLSLLVPPGSSTPVTASGLSILRRAAATPLGASRGVARVSYEMGDVDGQLPARADLYVDQHVARVTWDVRDLYHYRIAITTERPALQAGTVTYIRNGSRLIIDDQRSGDVYGGVPAAPPGKSTRTAAARILNGLMTGWSAWLPGTGNTAASIVQEFRSLDVNLLHPPEFARLDGTATIAGLPAREVSFGPLERQDYITGCSFQRPGHCTHHPQGSGVGHIWIARGRPLILRYQMAGPRTDRFMLNNLDYQVVRVRTGTSLSQADLLRDLPPHISHVADPLTIGGSNDGSVGPPFLDVPNIYNPTLLLPSVSDSSNDATGRTVSDGQILSKGTYASVPNEGPHIVTGPYVYVQQRLQVHGLPVELHHGRPLHAASCSIYSGTYSDGQHWAAFQHGPVSVLISTNTLTSRHLRGYAASMCREPESR